MRRLELVNQQLYDRKSTQRKKNELHFKTQPPAFSLGQVININKLEERDKEEQNTCKEAFQEMKEQCSEMKEFMKTFHEMQTHQLDMMNNFLGAMTQFVQRIEQRKVVLGPLLNVSGCFIVSR